jgi:hypothetical protein
VEILLQATGSESGKPFPGIHFLAPGIHPGKPDFQVSILENRASRYPFWKTGLPGIHPGKPDFQGFKFQFQSTNPKTVPLECNLTKQDLQVSK